ncbi:MAG: fibronectin type III domain-containing protein [Luminiphilus sp.]|nr:fibronectin type III domain-containing protein [Luminiphilus sp.]
MRLLRKALMRIVCGGVLFCAAQPVFGSLFDGKYGQQQVFDVWRTGGCTQVGSSCGVYNFSLPYVAPFKLPNGDWGSRVVWAEGDYVQFVSTGRLASGNPDVQLIQYSILGAQKQVLSDSGYVQVLGDGLLYIGVPNAWGGTGYFVSNEVVFPNPEQYNSSPYTFDVATLNPSLQELQAYEGSELDAVAYSVSATAAAGGSVSCSATSVEPSGSSTCTAAADFGYQFNAWTGACAGQGATCSLTNITSDQSSAASFITVPGAPTSATASGSDGQATVSWTAPTSTGGAAISGYTVTAAPGGAQCTTTGATSCTVTSLSNGTSYTFTVTATNSVGTGSASSASSAVIPTGAALTSTFASPSSTADGFTVQVSNHDSDYTYAATTTAGSVSISNAGLVTVTGLTPGQSATVTITTSRTGYAGGSADVSGTATTGAASTDTDGDGTPDATDTDDDNDGVSDADEATNGTDPLLADTDGDGVNDGAEGTTDTDGDGVIDPLESSTADADGDGVVDQSDNANNDGSNDSDGDGVSNADEATNGTDPLLTDTDGDGANDGAEGTTDTDGDGVIDPLESSTADADGDGVVDQADNANNHGSNDSDGDGVSNEDEVAAGSDPNDGNATPTDIDGDGTPNTADTDDDNDGVLDVNEVRGDCRIKIDCDDDNETDLTDPFPLAVTTATLASGGYISTTPLHPNSTCSLNRSLAYLSDYTAPDGMDSIGTQAHFSLSGCDASSAETITVEVNFGTALPAEGLVCKVHGVSAPVDISNARISGTSVIYTLTDNGPFDTNPALGFIDDPVSVIAAENSPTAVPVPIKSFWSVIQGLLVMFLAFRALKSRYLRKPDC